MVLIGLVACATPGCVRAGYEIWPASGPDSRADGFRTGLDAGNPADASTADAGTADAGTADAAAATVRLVVSVEGASASYLQPIRVDVASSEVSTDGPPVRLEGFSTALRGIAGTAATGLLAGHGFAPRAALLDASLKLVATVEFEPWAGGQVANVHGACIIPGGGVVVGEYGTGSGNAVAEYGPLVDGRTSFVRPVYETVLKGGTLSACSAPGPDEIYLTDTDCTTDNDGDVVRLARENGKWVETDRFDTSSFGTITYGTSHQTAIFTFVVHTDGSIYLFPLRRWGGRIKSLISCPTPRIAAGNCVEYGPLPPDTDSVVNGPDMISAAVQVPGHADLLFVTNRALYRFQLAHRSWVELSDMRSDFAELRTGDGKVDQLRVARGLLVF